MRFFMAEDSNAVASICLDRDYARSAALDSRGRSL
jgi:hypothetical protein